MKNFTILLAFILLIATGAKAQTADEILDNGIPVKKGEKIILKFDLKSKTLLYDVGSGATNQPLDLIKYDDKSYFLIRRRSVNIYMVPVNPLNFSVNSEMSDRLDLVSSASSAALTAITTQITAMNALKTPKAVGPAPAGAPVVPAPAPVVVVPDCSANFAAFVTSSESIANKLKDDHKAQVSAAFTKLKDLTFDKEAPTAAGLASAQTDIAALTKYYDALKQEIAALQATLNGFDCNDASLKYLYIQTGTSAIKNMQTEMDNQTNRLKVLNDIYKLVNDAYLAAAGSNNNMLPWLINLGNVSSIDGKIADFTLKFNKGGYELQANKEIQASKAESINNYTISVRKFDFFVPEVAAGVVYANISYPKYGTTTNAAGKTVVADAGNDQVSKFSVSTMVNFNMFVPNSSIRPFVQLGIGANTDYPVLFLGGGLKISNSMSLSVGAASPWIKQLGTLKPGDEISGTAELEKDIVRTFKPLSKVYFGLQIKL